MNRKTLAAVLLSMLLLCGCSKRNAAAEPVAEPTEKETAAAVPDALPEPAAEPAEKLSDEQALAAIRYYCFTMNPDLEGIVSAEEYPVYWEISSSAEDETVVLYRSYTGALVRYYVNRESGETYVTEFVPGITPEEQRADESFNAKDYLSGD